MRQNSFLEIGRPANVESGMKGNIGLRPSLDSEIITKIRNLRISCRQTYRIISYASE